MLLFVPLVDYSGHTSAVRGLCWNSEIPYLFLSGGWDGLIRIWDVRTQFCYKSIQYHQVFVCLLLLVLLLLVLLFLALVCVFPLAAETDQSKYRAFAFWFVNKLTHIISICLFCCL